MSRIRVLVCGAAGRMGREVVCAVHSDEELELVGAVDVACLGADAGELAGVGALGCPISNDLPHIVKESRPEVSVVFTSPAATPATIRALIESGVAAVVGSTGWYQHLHEIEDLAIAKSVPIFVAPNFAIGAALLMKFAQQAAQYLDHAEIIELHHDKKADAPSGTAEWTARLIAGCKPEGMKEASTERFSLEGVRGGNYEGIHIHSVRLPGFVAHQEVIFGGIGQVLTLRHDSIDRTSFMPGVLYAIKKVRTLTGLIVGLERIL